MRHAGTVVEREAPRPVWRSRVLVLLLFTVGGLLALGVLAGAVRADEGKTPLPVSAVSSDAAQETTPVVRQVSRSASPQQSDPSSARGSAQPAAVEPVEPVVPATTSAAEPGVPSAIAMATQPVAATAEVTAQATADVTEPVSATAKAVARAVVDTAEPVASTVTVVVESTSGTASEVVDETGDRIVAGVVDPITDAPADILPPVLPAPMVPAPAVDAPTGDAAPLGAGTPVAPASAAIVADPTADQATAAARGIGSTVVAAGTDRPTTTPAGVPAAPPAPVEAGSWPGTPRANGGHTATGLSATVPSALAPPAPTSVVSTAPVETLLHGSNAEPSSSPD
jgi:hypothetical protein